jgi:hypothetical protein
MVKGLHGQTLGTRLVVAGGGVDSGQIILRIFGTVKWFRVVFMR